jgi:hypothetical protein
VEGSCEHGNEPSGSIKCWEFLEWLYNWQLLKDCWAPWVSEAWNFNVKFLRASTPELITLYSVQCDSRYNPWRTLSFIHSFIRSFIIHQCLCSPLLGLGLFFRFPNFFTQMVAPLEPALISSQGRYLHTEQHKLRTNVCTDIPCLERDSNPRSQRSSERAATVIGEGYFSNHYFTNYATCDDGKS